jgi:S1-C subfamily serine protease
MRETDLFVHLLRTKKVGDEVPFTVWRDGERVELTLRMQE